MLVKISESYRGNYGYKNPATGIVELKTAASEPFEVEDGAAARHIKNGVLVAVDGVNGGGGTDAPAAKDPDEMTYNELKDEARRLGISFVGKNRGELSVLVAATMREKENAGDDMPDFDAEDPV